MKLGFCTCAEVTVKQLKEKIKELDERLESTAQVWLTLVMFASTESYFCHLEAEHLFLFL